MSDHLVVVTQRIHPEVAELLSSDAKLIVNNGPDAWSRAQLLAHSREADALLVFMPDSIDDQFLAGCPRLKIIAAALKGFDNFDVEACTRRGVWFTIVPDLLTEPTAELALALALGLARNVSEGDRLLRRGEFQGWRPILYGQSLFESTVGIVGLGSVGLALAKLLNGFRCRLLYSDVRRDRRAEEELGLTHVALAGLLAAADFVFPLVPLTPSTHRLFGRETLAQMKPGSFLINVSRGSVVDEEAGADALEAGRLAGYAADTYELEDWAQLDRPREVSPRLLQLKSKTLFTPHLGSAVASVRLAIERAAASNILQALRGERPKTALNNPKDLTDAAAPPLEQARPA